MSELFIDDVRLYWSAGRPDGNVDDAFAILATGGKVYVALGLDWERQPSYLLNISVTDGTHVVYTQVRFPYSFT